LKLVGEQFSPSTQFVLHAGYAANSHFAFENLKWGDSKREELKGKSQTATLPILETSHGIISESAAIAEYLIESSKPELLGKNAFEKAQVRQWSEFAANEIMRNNKALVYPIFGFTEFDKTAADAALKDVIAQLKVLDKHLEGKKHAVGDSLTYADIVLFKAVKPYLTMIIPEQQRKAMYGNLTTWFTAVAEEKSSVKAYGRTLLCKVPQKAPAKKEEHHHHEHKKEEHQHKKEEKKEKKEDKEEKAPKEGDDDDEEDKPKKKAKNPLDILPPSPFVLDSFKKEFLNTTEKAAVLKDFWEKIDLNGYSFWYLHYKKLPSEGKVLFKTSNSSSFFLQKLDPFRKYTFCVHGVYGVEGNYDVKGVWMWRGLEIPEEIKEHDNYEYMTIKKLDPLNENDKKFITEYWLHLTPGEVVDGTPVCEVVYFK